VNGMAVADSRCYISAELGRLSSVNRYIIHNARETDSLIIMVPLSCNLYYYSSVVTLLFLHIQ